MAPAGALSSILDTTENTKMPPKKNQQPTDLPILHSAVPNQNMFSVSDSAGNRSWAGVGKSINGYKLKDFDKAGKSVTFEKDGRMYVVGLQGSAPTPYVPPAEPIRTLGESIGATSYAQDPTLGVVGTGTLSNAEQQMQNSFDFDDATFSSVVENTKQSPFMTDENRKNIMRLKDYMKKAENNELEVGKKYFIPKLFPDGNIDFDMYEHKGREGDVIM